MGTNGDGETNGDGHYCTIDSPRAKDKIIKKLPWPMSLCGDVDSNNALAPWPEHCVHSAIKIAASAPISRLKKAAPINFFQFCEQHQLDAAECALADILEGFSACVSANEPGEPIVWVNQEFAEMTGWPREDVLGHPCKFLQGEATTKESRAECRRLIETKEEGFVSLVNYTKQGTEFDNALYIRPLYSKGECRFFLGSQLDMRGLLKFCRRVSFCEEVEVLTFEGIYNDDNGESENDPMPWVPRATRMPFSRPAAQISFYQFCELNQLELESGLEELTEGCSACISANEPGEPIVWVNNEFLNLVGWLREEVIGKPCKFLQGEKTTVESRAEVRRLIDSQSDGFVSLVNYTKDGREFDNALYMRPLYSKGHCRFFLGSQLDLPGLMRFFLGSQPDLRGVLLASSPNDTPRSR